MKFILLICLLIGANYKFLNAAESLQAENVAQNSKPTCSTFVRRENRLICTACTLPNIVRMGARVFAPCKISDLLSSCFQMNKCNKWDRCQIISQCEGNRNQCFIIERGYKSIMRGTRQANGQECHNVPIF